MKIKDQIRSRREQLGVSVQELARRVSVSAQAVRHWEKGRSFPAKRVAPSLESALSFRLDWTEGVRTRAERPDVTALLDQEDIDIMLVIRKLPSRVKRQLAGLAQMYLDALDTGRTPFHSIETEESVEQFHEPIKKSPGRSYKVSRKRSAA